MEIYISSNKCGHTCYIYSIANPPIGGVGILFHFPDIYFFGKLACVWDAANVYLVSLSGKAENESPSGCGRR